MGASQQGGNCSNLQSFRQRGGSSFMPPTSRAPGLPGATPTLIQGSPQPLSVSATASTAYMPAQRVYDSLAAARDKSPVASLVGPGGLRRALTPPRGLTVMSQPAGSQLAEGFLPCLPKPSPLSPSSTLLVLKLAKNMQSNERQ